jgi:hypothetical protein
MKVVILAGGLGTRISEESHLRPKPKCGLRTVPVDPGSPRETLIPSASDTHPAPR